LGSRLNLSTFTDRKKHLRKRFKGKKNSVRKISQNTSKGKRQKMKTHQELNAKSANTLNGSYVNKLEKTF